MEAYYREPRRAVNANFKKIRVVAGFLIKNAGLAVLLFYVWAGLSVFSPSINRAINTARESNVFFKL